MAIPGRYNTLDIVKIVDFGVYLDGGDMGEILLPMKWVPDGCQPNDSLEVFIYFDSSDRPIATTMKPYAQVGEFAFLKVKAVNDVGAFLDWGLEKDLLVPFREQKVKMVEGKYYVVYVFSDERSNRIAASAKIENFFSSAPPEYEPGEQVNLMLWRTSELGYLAIINNAHEGLLYASEVYTDLHRGQQLKGYVTKVREDGKIDLTLQPPGYGKIDQLAEGLLDLLRQNKGFLGLTDKSPAEEIYLLCGMSKKNFKKSIGALYKKRLISLEDNGIRLMEYTGK
ncbi:S1-like domain-containing RNA-binding protein [Lentimicrobium sp.]